MIAGATRRKQIIKCLFQVIVLVSAIDAGLDQSNLALSGLDDGEEYYFGAG